MIRVCFVCMGNICRSPTAEGVFRKLVENAGLEDHIEVDSAGTIDFHLGEAPDERSQTTARRRGIDISHLRARQVHLDDFGAFDYIVALDRDNLAYLKQSCPDGYQGRLSLLMAHAPEREEDEVPDPYYGGPAGFERVFDMVEEAGRGLLERIRSEHLASHGRH
jgi:protein-tyrosine phosphatase